MLILPWIVLGIVLGIAIGNMVLDRIVLHGPDSNMIKSQVLRHNGKWIRFETVPHLCPL